MRLRHQQLVLLVLAAFVVALLVASGAFVLIRSSLRERYSERIGAETALLAEWVRELQDPVDFQPFATEAAARLGVRVTLIAADGIVVADSAAGPARLEAMENHIGRPEVRAARLRGAGQSFRRSATTNVEYFYSAALVAGQGPVKYARIALPSSRVYQLETRYAWLIVGVVLVSMVLFTGVGYAAVRRFSYPLERMAQAVESSVEGESALRLPQEGGLEITRLADSVRRMQRALLEKISELGAERAVLSSVISGMREGLLLIDSGRRVRLANRPLAEIFGLSFDPQGRPIAEVVRHPSVLRDVEAALTEGGHVRESLFRPPGSERTFELHVTPLQSPADGSSQGVLVLFFEITRLEKLEAVRREFVANVSHELRTPLTSIKAFVENMIDGGLDDRENAQRFMGIIDKHANRMSDLIEDLTDLSLIETGAVVLELREVDAGEVVRAVLEQLRSAAAERGVALEAEIATPFPLVADRRRLEQMLTNLVDNAVKFNRQGGRVRVAGRRGEAGAVIEVEDTGIGIAAESQEKIFNRFFRAHRERPRDVKGTGLGLAIVKHLMRLHGGSVTVSSELGQGATFVLSFPAGRPVGVEPAAPDQRG